MTRRTLLWNCPGSLVTANLADTLVHRLGYGRSLLLACLAGMAGTALAPAAFGPQWLILVFILGQQVLGDGGDTVFEVGFAGLRQSRLTTNCLDGSARFGSSLPRQGCSWGR